MMGKSTTIILASIMLLQSITAKFIPTNKKINADQLSINDANELYSNRLNPIHLIKKRSVSTSDQPKRRVTRDTLLSLYRQKQLYKNLNRNLLESYFQSPSDEYRSNRNGNNNNASFKKLVTNPYKDYKKSKSNNDIRPVYKKHPGFHVTDSVNHLKYLVEKKPEDSQSDISNEQQEDQATLNNARQAMVQSSNAYGNTQDFTRQRRGEFYHSKDGNNRPEMSEELKAVFNQLMANNDLR